MVLLFIAPLAHAATSVMIWPIDPVIESDQSATALWLENRDRRPVTLQVRVLGWREVNGEDIYDEDQDRVAGSPPMVTVEPGNRQLIRLIRLTTPPPNTEEAYRVLIDELPHPDGELVPGASGPTLGVKFQMHYSIPLFVYGQGLWTKDRPDKQRDLATAAQPALTWRITTEGSKRWLVIANRGPVHARLTHARMESHGVHTDVGGGLFGYVLPGAQMRWGLPDSLRLGSAPKLVVTINGIADRVVDPHVTAPTR